MKKRRTYYVIFDNSNEILRLGKGKYSIHNTNMIKKKHIIRDQAFDSTVEPDVATPAAIKELFCTMHSKESTDGKEA